MTRTAGVMESLRPHGTPHASGDLMEEREYRAAELG